MKTWPLLIAAAVCSVSAEATPIRLDGSETNLQQVLDGITTDGSSSVNVVSDQIVADESWTMSEPHNLAVTMLLVEIAGYFDQNRFGIYDIANPNRRVELFSGPQGTGALNVFGIGNDGSVYRNGFYSGTTFSSGVFGFYLQTPAGLWYSQSSRNADGADHMVAYAGENDVIQLPYGFSAPWTPSTYLLAWEDLASSHWDQDYNDFAALVTGVQTAVPEPATLALFGLGLAGIGLSRRKRAAAV